MVEDLRTLRIPDRQPRDRRVLTLLPYDGKRILESRINSLRFNVLAIVDPKDGGYITPTQGDFHLVGYQIQGAQSTEDFILETLRKNGYSEESTDPKPDSNISFNTVRKITDYPSATKSGIVFTKYEDHAIDTDEIVKTTYLVHYNSPRPKTSPRRIIRR